MPDTAQHPDPAAFRGFFENLAVGGVQISPEGAFLEVNTRFCALTGYGRDELLGMRVGDLDHPDDREEDRIRWAAFLADPGAGYDVEKRYVRRDGSVIWVHVTAARIRPGTDQPLIAKTVEDITARVTAAHTLMEREERLREALAAREEFLGLVSHELRTPLTVILGLADIVARDGMPAERARAIVLEIRESAQHLATLLESMLVLARTGSDDDPGLEPIELRHLLTRAAERHREVFPRREIALQIRTETGLVEGHQPWLGQVIANMLGNAEKYSSEGGRIVLVLERIGSAVVVRVLDEGPGVDDADLLHVFEPFYRSPSARAASGLGLGLAVCKRLVELQGGTVWARPRDAGGAEFGFSLPALVEDGREEGPAALPAAEEMARVGTARLAAQG